MNYCELQHDYFTGAAGEFTQRPTVGDWVEAPAPVVPNGQLAYWNSATQGWGFVANLGQRELFGQRALTRGQFRDRLTAMEQLCIDNFADAEVLQALGLPAPTVIQRGQLRMMRESRLDSALIDPCHPQTVAAAQFYASLGFVSPTRVDEILKP